MAFTDPADLTKAESDELRTHFAAYGQTPNSDKENFRLDRTRHILTARNLSEENSYAFAAIYKKVTYIFHNRGQDSEKAPRLPYKIARAYTPLRVFGYTRRDDIRAAVAETYGHQDEESDWYIRQWNSVQKKLYEELSPEDKLEMESKCAEWNTKGPEDHFKPLIANKRAGEWMRAVCAMFWEQCGMYVFMYGMYESPDGDVRAIPYDTTDMLHSRDPKVPRFRDVPHWDHDFRDTLWDFFPALINPETAKPEARQLVEKVKERNTRPSITFERYEDGTPVLFNRDEEGGDLKPQMRRWVMKEYLSIHHQWAAGSESFKAPPWDAFHDHPAQFFAPGMLPEGVLLGDLEHMHNDALKNVFDHIVRMERPEDDTPPRRFRLSSYRSGRGKNATYLPAKYTPPTPPVAKKARSIPPPPIIYGPRDEDERPAPVPTRKGRSAKQNTQLPVASASPGPSDTGDSGTRRDKGKGVDRGTQLPQTSSAGEPIRGQPPSPGNNARWEALERSAHEIDSDDDGSDSSLTELDNTRPADDNDAAISVEMEYAPPSQGCSGDTDVGVLYLAPRSVGTDGKKRYEFLCELSAHKDYTDMLLRVRSLLEERSRLTGRAPVKWATWSRDSAHLPSSIHTDPRSLPEVMTWLRSGVNRGEGSAAIQRYCLVVGMVIRDVTEVQMLEPGAPLPSHLPGYFADSTLPFDALKELLNYCSNAFPPPPGPRAIARSSKRSSLVQDPGTKANDTQQSADISGALQPRSGHSTAAVQVAAKGSAASAVATDLAHRNGLAQTQAMLGASEIASDDEDDCDAVGTLLGLQSEAVSAGSGRKRARSDVHAAGVDSATPGGTRLAGADAAAPGATRATRSRTKAAKAGPHTVPEAPKSPTAVRADASQPVKRGRRGRHR